MKILRRNLSLMLALRYLNPLRTLFSVITLICLVGVALGVMVLIVVLSVMGGLQKEMEERVLAFTPHYVIAQSDGMKRIALSQERTDWEQLVEQLQAMPNVASAYPQLEGQAFAQSEAGRIMAQFAALQPHNQAQLAPLLPMLKEGTFDFGEGFDTECVISRKTATSLGLQLGDELHLTPVGSIDEVAAIYAMIQNPLITQSDEQFMQNIRGLFDGATPANGGEVVELAKLESIINTIRAYDPKKMRQSEIEACGTLYKLAVSHTGGVPFTAEEKELWQNTANGIAELDRDREDGKAVKSINEMVMPVDLRVVGIYQAPENMDGPNVYMPLSIAQEVVGYSNEAAGNVMGLCVRLQNAHEPGDIQQQMESILPDNTASTEELPLGAHWFITPWTSAFEQWHKLIANERIMMNFVLSAINLIASFCIMAVMFTMSIQRKREIAVLQALGATPGKIMGIFAWQGVIIGLAGSILGIILALLVLYYRFEIQAALASIGMDPFPMEAHGITIPAEYDPVTFGKQALMAFIMVVIASIVPAFIVSRQDPAKALRSN
ncbi:MAG: ABC transporter permease [Akkermansia sp.]|nr:ABC transporter permease [Akkermansia sp.]